MSLLDNLPDTCNIKRRKRVKDARLGNVDTFPTTLYTNQACWWQLASDAQVKLWQSRGMVVTHRVFFNEILDNVDTNCVLEFDGDRYDVTNYSEDDAFLSLGLVFRVDVKWLEEIV